MCRDANCASTDRCGRRRCVSAASSRSGLMSRACRIARAGDDQLTLLLRVAPAGHWRDAARRVSYADALDPARVADQRFKDRIVLVGAMDVAAAPRRHPRRSRRLRAAPGVRRRIAGRRHRDARQRPSAATADRRPATRHDADCERRRCGSRSGAVPPAALVASRYAARTRCWRGRLLRGGLQRATSCLNPAHDVIAMLLSYLALRAAQWFARTFQRLRRPST